MQFEMSPTPMMGIFFIQKSRNLKFCHVIGVPAGENHKFQRKLNYFQHSFGAMNGTFDGAKIVDSTRVSEKLE